MGARTPQGWERAHEGFTNLAAKRAWWQQHMASRCPRCGRCGHNPDTPCNMPIAGEGPCGG